jgi:hypothetical protein
MSKVSYKRTKAVNVPVLKLHQDIPVIVEPVEAIYQGKALKSDQGAELKPALLMKVIDLGDEEQAEKEIVVASVLNSILTEKFPNDSYVGKRLEITKLTKVDKGAGKSYYTYSVYEIELD